MSAHGVYISDYKYMEDIPINYSDIIVAVIDDHISEVEGLEGQFWVNESELNGTAGVDDDGNGYVDDVHGWDFDGDQPIDVSQGSDHGNYVTGVIAATLSERDDGI